MVSGAPALKSGLALGSNAQTNKPSLGLNIAAVKANDQKHNGDFQDDFLANYDEFSESWRKACD